MHALTRLLLAGLCAAATASAVQAQSRLGHVPNKTTSPSAQTAQAAPRPGGLMPVFPAGISSGSGAAVSTDPIAASTSPVPPASTTTPPGATIIGGGGGGGSSVLPDGAAVPATNVLGAGGVTVRGPGPSVAGAAGGFRAAEIADAFLVADANRDGELTRAEAAGLRIVTMSFEEMDRNFDGVVSRFEYQDAVR